MIARFHDKGYFIHSICVGGKELRKWTRDHADDFAPKLVQIGNRLRVAHNPNDSEPRASSIKAPPFHALANWILARPKAFNERLPNKTTLGQIRRIRVREVPPLDHSFTNILKVIRYRRTQIRKI